MAAIAGTGRTPRGLVALGCLLFALTAQIPTAPPAAAAPPRPRPQVQNTDVDRL